MVKFLQVTNKRTNTRHSIAIDKIMSVLEEPEGNAFVELYMPAARRTWGITTKEGYEQIMCMLSGVFEGHV